MAIETRPETATTEQYRDGEAPPWTDFAHVGPGTLAGRYLRRFWHPVMLARDLKAAGLPEKFKDYGNGFIKTDRWIETIYNSATKK